MGRAYKSESECARDWASVERLVLKVAGDVGRGGDIGDIVAHCLERVCEARPVENLAGWVSRVAYNRSVRERRERARWAHDELNEEMVGEGEGGDDRVWRGEVRRAVRAALAELPPKERRAAELYFLRDMKGVDGARAAGAHPDAFKTNVHRARLYLREKLAAFKGYGV